MWNVATHAERSVPHATKSTAAHRHTLLARRVHARAAETPYNHEPKQRPSEAFNHHHEATGSRKKMSMNPEYTVSGIAQHLVGMQDYSGLNGLGKWEADHEISITDVLGKIPIIGGKAQSAMDTFLPVALTSQVISRSYGNRAFHSTAEYSASMGVEVGKLANVNIAVGIAKDDFRGEASIDFNIEGEFSFEQLVRDGLAEGLRILRRNNRRQAAKTLVDNGVVDFLAGIFPEATITGNIGFDIGRTNGLNYVRIVTMFGAEMTLTIPKLIPKIGPFKTNPTLAGGNTGGRSWQLIVNNMGGHMPKSF